MLSNGVAIVAVSVAARGPDDDHPYGHEKFEALGTLAIVCFLSITCFELLRQSVGELMGGRAVPHGSMTDGVLLVSSLVVNLFVVWYERRRGRQLSSALLLADASHTASDILHDTRREGCACRAIATHVVRASVRRGCDPGRWIDLGDGCT